MKTIKQVRDFVEMRLLHYESELEGKGLNGEEMGACVAAKTEMCDEILKYINHDEDGIRWPLR